MAHGKQAFIGLGIAFAAILMYGATQGQKTRNTFNNAQERLVNIGLSEQQIKEVKAGVGGLDVIDNVLGNYGPHSKSKAIDSTVVYLEQQANINKARIRNINVGKIAAKIKQSVDPKVLL